jgi:hypothetical protein
VARTYPKGETSPEGEKWEIGNDEWEKNGWNLMFLLFPGIFDSLAYRKV